MKEKLKLVSTEDELKEMSEADIIPLARKLGYSFTCEQLLNYRPLAKLRELIKIANTSDQRKT